MSCFVPAFNEVRVISRNLEILDDVLAHVCPSHEIIVVDDGSTDGTGDAVAALGRERVRLLRFPAGPSFRGNLGRAMQQAEGAIGMFVDADLPVDADSIQAVLARVQDGADVAVGSRYLRESKAIRRFHRLAVSVVYNHALRLLFASGIHDHQCGLKVFRRDVLRALLASMYEPAYRERGWFWDAELLVRAQWAGYRVAEVPVRWIFRVDSHFMPLHQVRILPRAVWTLWKEQWLGRA